METKQQELTEYILKVQVLSVSNSMKFTPGGYDVWDSKRYLNIWVCTFLEVL